MKQLIKQMLAIVVISILFGGSVQATPIVISFGLQTAGFKQNDPVSENYFASQGLILSSGVVTACAGACISTPASDFTGTLSGHFTNNTFNYLFFDTLFDNASISLFDSSNTLITTLIPQSSINGNYTYDGPERIASFAADLNFDALLSLTLENRSSASSVPEPSSLALMVIGLVSIGLSKRKKT